MFLDVHERTQILEPRRQAFRFYRVLDSLILYCMLMVFNSYRIIRTLVVISLSFLSFKLHRENRRESYMWGGDEGEQTKVA